MDKVLYDGTEDSLIAIISLREEYTANAIRVVGGIIYGPFGFKAKIGDTICWDREEKNIK